MSGNSDLGVDQGTLARLTKGINGAIDELGDISGVGESSVGRGFSELSLTGMEAGHSAVTEAFGDFCDRWEWGVRALVRDGNELAQRLGLSAGMFHQEEQYIKGTFKIAVSSAMASPDMTEEEMANRSWSDTWQDNPLSHVRNADYSAESYRQSAQDIKQTWKDTGRDLVTDGQGGAATSRILDVAGVDEEAFEEAADTTFGPSPEERQRQAESSAAAEAER